MKTIYQFGYKTVQAPIPKGVVVDCRCIPNPYFAFAGKASDTDYKNHVRNSPRFEDMVKETIRLLEAGEVAYVGCTYGKHRSGAVVDEVVARCSDPREWGWKIQVKKLGPTGEI